MRLKTDYPIRPVHFTDVRVDDAFWSPRLDTNRRVTLPYCFRKCEEYGRVDNFAIAAGRKTGEHRGRYTFDDTDVFKLIEAASYALSVRRDPELERTLDGLVELIAGAQEPDGYLMTARRNRAPYLAHRCGEARWSRLLQHSHELYNLGHLYEAAVAHHLATGKRALLDVAVKSAELVAGVFGPGRNERPVCHPIIEMALVRLYRVTGDERHLRLARFILDARGQGGEAYTQDHARVVDQAEAVGHAVRAAYLYAGMTDIAALQGDAAYARAVDRLWDSVVERKLFLTGGIGARHSGEAFGDAYELPNASAYCETCASIGFVYWCHRMFLLHGDARYVDALERTLYNALLAGVSLSGDRFFYPNPLESFGEHGRSEWFGCACCPGNVARLVPSVPGYAYAARGDDVFVSLFLGGEAAVATDAGGVRVTAETRYPWEGRVRLTVAPEQPRDFALRVRIPGWARNAPVAGDLYRYLDPPPAEPVRLAVNGAPAPLELDRGYAVIRRAWRAGDVVELDLPMPVRRVVAHDAVAEDRGKAALERGPIVFCAEWPDQPDGRVLDRILPDDAPLAAAFRPDLLGGVPVISGRALSSRRAADGRVALEPAAFAAIPYFAWANRGSGEMAVWLPRDAAAARPDEPEALARRSRVSVSGGGGPAPLHAALLARHSEAGRGRLLHWRADHDGAAWAECAFDRPRRVGGVEVYWFDATDNGDVEFPTAWSLQYRDGTEWKPVAARAPFAVTRYRFNRVPFAPVETAALRLEAQLPRGTGGGIVEWRVLEDAEGPVATREVAGG